MRRKTTTAIKDSNTCRCVNRVPHFFRYFRSASDTKQMASQTVFTFYCDESIYFLFYFYFFFSLVRIVFVLIQTPNIFPTLSAPELKSKRNKAKQNQTSDQLSALLRGCRVVSQPKLQSCNRVLGALLSFISLTVPLLSSVALAAALTVAPITSLILHQLFPT